MDLLNVVNFRLSLKLSKPTIINLSYILLKYSFRWRE